MATRKINRNINAGPTTSLSLFEVEEVSSKEISVTRTVYHEEVKKTAKKFDLRNIGINSDYEKYGEIKLLKNKLI